MNIKNWFKKRTVLVSALTILLMVVGFLNRQLTEDALLQSSKGYKNYEETQISKNKNTDKGKAIETSAKSIQVVESKNTPKIKDDKKDTKDTSYFVEQRLSRDKTRGEAVERLNKIIEDEKTKGDTKDIAQNELIEIGDISETELFLEGTIKAKGFKDVVVFLNDDKARIVIDKDDLSEQDVMKALEVVVSETKIETQNIKIMKKQ